MVMESQGGGQQQPLLMRQSSLYSLSLDQVQTHLGKPLRSMNLEELLNSLWSAESNLESGGGTVATIDKAVGKRTVGQVWKDIQEEQAHGRQVITLGEMTLEDLLARAGAHVPMSAAHQQTINVAMGGHGAGSLHVYEDDIQMLGRKRIAPGDVAEKTVERRQKRMIKNRESAARSRARKQAYTNELENKVSRLEEENERLKKQTELEMMLRCAPPPEPKYQLRRTTSSPF